MIRVRKIWITYVIGLTGLLMFYLLSDVVCWIALCGEEGLRIVNTIGLTTLLLLCGSVVLRILRRDAVLILTPTVIFPVTVALYFAFGNMFFLFGDAGFLIDFSTHRYSVTQSELFRANMLTTTGILTVAISMLSSYHFRVTQRNATALFARPRLSLPTTAALLLIFGLSIEAGEFLLRLSQGPTARLPGLIQNLDVSADLGLAVALFLGVKGHRGWYLLFWILWFPYVGYSLLEFAKTDLMFAILLPAVGAYLAHGSVRRILPFVLLAALGFIFVQDLNSASRIEVRAAAVEGRTFSLADRASVLLDSFVTQRSARGSAHAEDVSQVWWQRLAYAGPQVRAMELYDAGYPTSWQVNPLVYFIPRAVWPNKPTMPALGREFNWQVVGNNLMATRVGITIYANGYWMLGWPGVILFAAVYGFILGQITLINRAIVSNRNFVFFPAVFLGISISLAQMGFFETSVMGGLSVYIGLLVVTRIALVLAHSYSAPASRGRAIT